MVIADYYYPDWEWLVDYFCNPGLKICWHGRPGIEPFTIDLSSSQVPMASQPWRPHLFHKCHTHFLHIHLFFWILENSFPAQILLLIKIQLTEMVKCNLIFWKTDMGSQRGMKALKFFEMFHFLEWMKKICNLNGPCLLFWIIFIIFK